MSNEVKTLEKAFSEKLQSIDEKHSREIKLQKDMWSASEKIKREKWMQDKTKTIRDQTVKSLEPEIQRMLSVISYEYLLKMNVAT